MVYTEFRSFQKNFTQFCILKQKSDVKIRLLYEVGPEYLKNVQYLEIVDLNRHSARLPNGMYQRKILSFEVI